MIPRIDLRTGQVPTETDWESYFNRVIDYLNDGLPADGLATDAGGKVPISITGDAATVGGRTVDQIVGGDVPDVKKTMIDMLSGGPLVLSGGVATRDATTASQLNITAVKLVQKVAATGFINRVELPVSTKSTTLGNTTYYLDVVPNATDYTWGTAHPTGDYATLATVNTDASGNISTVSDTRQLTVKLFQGFDVTMQLQGLDMGAGYGVATTTNELILYHPATAAIKVRQASKTGPVIGTVWHSGNDGVGSGLDADRVRGAVPPLHIIRGLYQNAFLNVNPAFPIGAFAGAKAVSDQDGRYVYYQGANNTTTFYRRDFAQMYNIGWTAQTGPGVTWKNGASLVCVYDPTLASRHKIFAVFGAADTNFKAFNPDTNGWEVKANLPVASNPGSFLCESSDLNSIYYVPGGIAANAAGVYKYTISTNTWSASLTNIPYASNDGTCADLVGDSIFVRWGGGNNLSQFNTLSNAWSTSVAIGATMSPGASMMHIGGGTFVQYISGGSSEPLRLTNFFNGSDYGDPTTLACYAGGFIFVANGKIYFSPGNNTTTLYMWGV